jgi:ankyrin repeat protein
MMTSDTYDELFRAAKNGHLSKVEYLISKGADVNAKQAYGSTLLAYAAMNEHLHVIEYLLEKGADVNAKCDYNGGWSALMVAACDGRLYVAEYLLANGADVNDTTSFGDTVLMCAAERGYLSVVEKFFAYGAEVNAKDYDGWTALTKAALNKHVHVMEYLLDKGAKIEDLKEEEKQFYINIIKLTVKAINKQRYKLTDKLLDIIDKTDYILNEKLIVQDGATTNTYYTLEEKELVKKYLVKRYGNIMTVLWGKYPGFLVFEAIMDNFCPAWKEIFTLQKCSGEPAMRSLYQLWGESKRTQYY